MTKFQFRFICMMLSLVMSSVAKTDAGMWLNMSIALAFCIGACVAARKEHKQ